MPSELNQCWKSYKTPSVIYVDLESLSKSADVCKTNLEKSSTTIVGENIPCGYSISAIWTFDGLGNKHDVYRGQDYMKKFCKFLRGHEMKIIDFEKRKMIPSTKEQQQSFKKTKICYICKKKFAHKYFNDINYRKARDHCRYAGKYGGAAHSMRNLKCCIPKEILVVFHSESKHDYHFKGTSKKTWRRI